MWLYSAMFMCVSCFGLVVSTCQVIGYRKTPLMTPSWGEEFHLHKAQVEESVCVCFSFVWFVYVPMCSAGPTQYIFHTPMARYSLFVLKVPLNTNKTNKQIYYNVLIGTLSRTYAVLSLVQSACICCWEVLPSEWWIYDLTRNSSYRRWRPTKFSSVCIVSFWPSWHYRQVRHIHTILIYLSW